MRPKCKIKYEASYVVLDVSEAKQSGLGGPEAQR